jgi:hypothetical protein
VRGRGDSSTASSRVPQHDDEALMRGDLSFRGSAQVGGMFDWRWFQQSGHDPGSGTWPGIDEGGCGFKYSVGRGRSNKRPAGPQQQHDTREKLAGVLKRHPLPEHAQRPGSGVGTSQMGQNRQGA